MGIIVQLFLNKMTKYKTSSAIPKKVLKHGELVAVDIFATTIMDSVLKHVTPAISRYITL